MKVEEQIKTIEQTRIECPRCWAMTLPVLSERHFGQRHFECRDCGACLASYVRLSP